MLLYILGLARPSFPQRSAETGGLLALAPALTFELHFVKLRSPWESLFILCYVWNSRALGSTAGFSLSTLSLCFACCLFCTRSQEALMPAETLSARETEKAN